MVRRLIENQFKENDMATNYVQEGDVLTLTAPTGGVVSGTGYLIGTLFVVALVTAAEGVAFAASVEGVWILPKTSAQAWTEGQKVFWDNSNHRADTDATVGQLIGVAAVVAANPTATGVVRLNCGVPAMAEGAQGAIADLTMGTNITAATANGSLTDSSATNPTDAQFNELAKELGTKVNAILAALRAAGVLAA